ncbi:uncharacterized protein RAG0_07044 [Rhynchosporium agropyri]|uniref:Uncharacterized protein n=1 Tax=Rhynchosporium agropyri TaxID=914238 RepID=A0A1E1KJR7_9HELO|nr:uncharacterized protein RAG0_07044 [Rhynchosporium agropyri]
MDCDMKKEEDRREMEITDVVGEEDDDAMDRRYENETPRNISALHALSFQIVSPYRWMMSFASEPQRKRTGAKPKDVRHAGAQTNWQERILRYDERKNWRLG